MSKPSLKKRKISKISTVMLLLLIVLTLFPFYIMIVGSFKTPISLVKYPIDLNPFKSLTTKNIRTVLEKSDIFLWLKNSFTVSILVAALTCVVSMPAGYAFARIKFKGGKAFFVIVMATLMMPKQVLLIPNYLVAQKLSLVNNMAGLILTSIAPASGVFLCRQFLLTLPKELFEAAEIDGCGEIKKLIMVALPLSMPVIGTTAIFAFFGTFNDYLWQLVVIADKRLKTLPIGVTMFAQIQQNNKSVQLASALLATVPLVVLFLCCQKFFIKGATDGSIKG